MKKNYHQLEKQLIGTSDKACLALVHEDGESLLTFGSDGKYYSYVGTFEEIDLKSMTHYRLEFECQNWLQIMDDDGDMIEFVGDEIRIYRCGDFGCIILVKGGLL